MMVTRMDGPNDSEPVEQQNPNWADVETAIRRLDGDTCTLVCLGIGEASVPHMSVGGGEGGQYVVYCTPDNRTFYNVINQGAPPGKVMLMADGHLGDYDATVESLVAVSKIKTFTG